MKILTTLYTKFRHNVFPKYDNLKIVKYFHYLFKRLAFYRLENFEREEKKDMDIEDAEWDILVILDACRHDLYEEVNGPTDYRYSPGSHSSEFIKEVFSEDEWENTVYVSANPHLSNREFSNLTGKNVDDVFHTVFHSYKNRWNEEKSTVMPKDLMKDFETAKKLFPDKNIIVHFMQPHTPFVNSEISYEVNQKESVWGLIQMGKIDRDELDNEVWQEYRRNLEFVLDEIEEEFRKLDSKVVFTSDHGNLVGESGFYGHPYKVHAEELLKVPWDEI